MFYLTDDLRIEKIRSLVPPAYLLEQLPTTEAASETVAVARKAAGRIVAGDDDRLLVIVGPCSIHDTEAALAYGQLLKSQAEKLSDNLQIIMRVYFEKPRTTVGWKGLINDPNIDGTFRINEGLTKARKLMLDLSEMGMPAGTEFLDTITPQFIADVVSWGAIGARTTESQVHRELASGLSMPVGFKNGTDGNVQIMVDAIKAAGHPHSFLSVTKHGNAAIVSTRGNEHGHGILRGGKTGPNYDAESVNAVAQALDDAGFAPHVMVDCSHGNSKKDHTRQPTVAESIATQIEGGSTAVMGVMIESNLVAGRQNMTDRESLNYGQSITDACLGWEGTIPVLERLAESVEARRQKVRAAG